MKILKEDETEEEFVEIVELGEDDGYDIQDQVLLNYICVILRKRNHLLLIRTF